MSTIKEIITALETSTHPIARAIHKGEHFKVLALGFKKGMILKEHQAHIPTKLIVVEGAVMYKEGENEVSLSKYEEHEIPVNIIHSVEAIEDSMCLLTQG